MKRELSSQGFTMIEILIALTLLGVALGTFCQIFISQSEAYKTQANIVQRQQELRAGLEIIARDFRSAGYPLLDQSFLKDLTAWIPSSFIPKTPQIVTPNGTVTVTSGGDNPDILSLVILLSSETNPTTLAQQALAGDTSIRLSLSGSESEAQYNISDTIYIGKPAETAQVKAIAGQTLIIDTDPFQPGNQGLKNSYLPGTEVGEISLVSYAVFNDQNDPGGKYHDPGIPVLKRKINACGFEPLAEDIIDLKIIPIKSDLFQVRLSVRINFPPTAKERVLTMSTQIMKRN
ncbi:MAG: prepilin-type N-terminal cleavage/methylation domain-containing protein [Thermodesulfobacteriota bacterium]|jgi:prepilin-type N-terminal cleavage/methylation domain-containing protein